MTATIGFDELREALTQQEIDGAAVGIDLGTTKSCIALARKAFGIACCTASSPGSTRRAAAGFRRSAICFRTGVHDTACRIQRAKILAGHAELAPLLCTRRGR